MKKTARTHTTNTAQQPPQRTTALRRWRPGQLCHRWQQRPDGAFFCSLKGQEERSGYRASGSDGLYALYADMIGCSITNGTQQAMRLVFAAGDEAPLCLLNLAASA